MHNKVYIIDGLRTPFGSFCGALKDIDVETLASLVIRELVNRNQINPEEFDAVHLGCANTAESKDVIAPVIARQALLKAGLPARVISSTIDRACCSGTDAIKRGIDMIRLGEANVVIAGGVQSMSRTPHVVRNLRWGAKLSNFTLEDCLFPPGYKDYNPVAVDAAEVAVDYGVGREEQDLWAYTSQQRYSDAEKEGKFSDEIMPLKIKDKTKNMLTFSTDEFPKPNTKLDKLKELPTIYGNPTITAGNAPGLNDGAAALILVSETKLTELNLKPLAEIITAVSVADEPKNIAVAPAMAVQKVLKISGLSIDELKRLEINEAFAAVTLVSSKILGGFNEEKVNEIRKKLNVNGGAIAIGHPLGATGARLVITLAYELRRLGGGYGIAAICGGLAQGDAILIRV